MNTDRELDPELATYPLWMPRESVVEQSVLVRYLAWLEDEHDLVMADYSELWRWSIDEPEHFWASIAGFFEVDVGDGVTEVLANPSMPGASWFPGGRLNYVDSALSASGPGPALIGLREDGVRDEISWDRLRGEVGALAAWLRSEGVVPGDRVVGYLPNVPAAVVSFLATAAVGAIWSSCSQDYSARGAADRFGQLEPVVLIAADGYHFGGRVHDRRDEVVALGEMLPTVRRTLWVANIGSLPAAEEPTFAAAVADPVDLFPERVAFDHPLWVLFSSGTTGRPKGIVHGHGGVVLEHLKYLGVHADLRPGDRFFYFTTTSWMVWNVLVSGLLRDATVVVYDGSPSWPDPEVLWRLVEQEKLTYFGTSASYLAAAHKRGVEPTRQGDMSSLRSMGSTGSPLAPSVAAWVNEVLPDVWLTSASGGTDIVSAFAGGVPTLPVNPGEIQAPLLGVALDAWDEDGRPLLGAVGEMVVTKPIPSMPLYFWDDPDGERYREAYFSTYPGVWRHGDWITVNKAGSIVVHGRSDATLNRFGVRLGSGEIYEVVETLPQIADSLVVGMEQPGGGYWLPLFIVLADHTVFDDGLEDRIKLLIRRELSPRHVPDDIIVVPRLPHTMTGKRMEVPVKRILMGVDLDKAANLSSVDDAAALRQFVGIAQRRAAHAPR